LSFCCGVAETFCLLWCCRA